MRLIIPMLLVALFPAERPDVSRRGEELVIRMPVELLEERDVSEQLATALTTTFVIEISSNGTSRGITEIRVRYDLWDEEFVVSRIAFDGASEERRLASRTELVRWWNEPVPLPPTVTTGNILEIEMVVLPFSLEDEDDARSWLSRSGGASSGTSRRSGIVEALIGTTLRARPLARHDWRIRLVEEHR